MDYYYYNEGMGDSNSIDGDVDNPLSIKHLYRSSIWEKSHIKYYSKPKEFSNSSQPRGDFPRFSMFLKLFKLFLPDGPVLLRIVRETNWYATTPDEHGIFLGGATWEPLTVVGLKAFLACTMLIGLKRQPN